MLIAGIVSQKDYDTFLAHLHLLRLVLCRVIFVGILDRLIVAGILLGGAILFTLPFITMWVNAEACKRNGIQMIDCKAADLAR